MSLEALTKLEQKVQMAIDTIALQQMEIDELKEKNERLAHEAENLRSGHLGLEEENSTLRKEHEAWQDRVRNLLGKMDDVE